LSERLPSAVAVAVLEFVHGVLLRAPRRVGHELQRELLGTWSARRGSYRILYEIHDHVLAGFGEASERAGVVRVVDVDHRRDVYRRR
jgi:mRNA interferase RelE/StbE